MRRLAALLALVLALFATSATGVLADDGSGCRYPDPTAGVDYGDINVR